MSISSIPKPVPIAENETDAMMFDLHAATDVETFWRSNLKLIRHVMPFHSCSLMLGITELRPSASRHHVASDPNPDYQPASSLSISANFLARHPRVKLYTFSHVVSEDPQALQRRLVQENALMGSWSEFVHLAFWNRTRPDAVLSVRRNPEQGDFLPHELDFLNRLHPVIDAALHRLRTLEFERSRSEGMERFLAGLPMPVLFLDFDLRLQFATQEGYEACATWNLGPKRAKSVNPRRAFSLPVEIARACAGFGAESAVDDDRQGVVSVEGLRVPHPTSGALVARVALSQPVRGPWAKPGFIVTFVQERNIDGAALPMPRLALDHLRLLSPCERRVALLVIEGFSNQAIAENLSKSERTVESQLNTIYRKFGGINRVQLVRLLS